METGVVVYRSEADSEVSRSKERLDSFLPSLFSLLSVRYGKMNAQYSRKTEM